jgi:myosin-1
LLSGLHPTLIRINLWPAQGVTYLLRDLPISAKEYAFGRSKIFIRSLSVLDQLEEWRRERIDELVTLIQKIWRGWHARQNWVKLRDSQVDRAIFSIQHHNLFSS